MIEIEKVELALKAAKRIAANKGETLQDWDSKVTPGQQSIYTFIDAEERHILGMTGKKSMLFGRVVSNDTGDVEAIMILYDTTNIMQLMVTFFLEPEGTYESLMDMKGIQRISRSNRE